MKNLSSKNILKNVHSRNQLILAYALYLVSMLFIVLLPFALIFSVTLLAKDNSQAIEHRKYMHRTLIWLSIGLLISAVLFFLAIGYFTLLLIWFWAIIRFCYGLICILKITKPSTVNILSEGKR